jgi:hypothetical protein
MPGLKALQYVDLHDETSLGVKSRSLLGSAFLNDHPKTLHVKQDNSGSPSQDDKMELARDYCMGLELRRV